MRITKKLVAKTCLPVYYDLIEKGKEMDKYDFLELLNKKECDFGICRLFESITNDYSIYDFKPIGKLTIIGTYYYQIPRHCYSKEEMIKCLQVRIDLLKSWLK